MKDSFGRRIHYLRVSLTDRCNLRCTYCMPENIRFQPVRDLMAHQELVVLISLFADLGFDKFRLTGGEPTLHPHIVDIVGDICCLPGVREVTMTTNGLRLAELAHPLAKAGLARCNISLDTLRPAQYHHITRRGQVEDVLQGIQVAEQAGLRPIKLNSVVMRGINDKDHIVELARLTLSQSWQIRFIEVMPFGEKAEFAQDIMVSAAEMRADIEHHLGPLQPLNDGQLDGEARLYQLQNAKGTLGFISSVSEPFCESCTRARLTADGRLRLCLLSDAEVDLLTPFREGASPGDLKCLIREAIWHKPYGHELEQAVVPVNRLMSQIGG